MFNRLVAQRLRASSSLDNRGDPGGAGDQLTVERLPGTDATANNGNHCEILGCICQGGNEKTYQRI